jgi:hypothetical protein
LLVAVAFIESFWLFRRAWFGVVFLASGVTPVLVALMDWLTLLERRRSVKSWIFGVLFSTTASY